MAVIQNKRIMRYLLMMVVSLLLVLNVSIGVSASTNYDRQEADACITISQRLSVKGGSNRSIDKLDWSNVNKKGQTALEHIQKHSSPNYQREMHGVFRGDAKTIIEEAWTNRGNAKIVSDNMGGTIYNIPYQNVGYNTGYINFGQQMNYVTIVVQDGSSKVWTAFPSFGDYGMKVSY